MQELAAGIYWRVVRQVLHLINERLSCGRACGAALAALPSLQLHRLPPQQLVSLDYWDYMCNLATERFIDAWRAEALRERTIDPSAHETEEQFALVERMREWPTPRARALTFTFGSARVPWAFNSNRLFHNGLLWRMPDLDELLASSSCQLLRDYTTRVRASSLHCAFVSDDREVESVFDWIDANTYRIVQDAGRISFIACYPTRSIPEWVETITSPQATSSSSSSSMASPSSPPPCDPSLAGTTSASTAVECGLNESATNDLHLLDLPFELLQLVLLACDRESLLNASGTCRQLQGVAMAVMNLLALSEQTDTPDAKATCAFGGATAIRTDCHEGRSLPATVQANCDCTTVPLLGRSRIYARTGIAVCQQETLELVAVDTSIGWARVRNAIGAAGWVPLRALDLSMS